MHIPFRRDNPTEPHHTLPCRKEAQFGQAALLIFPEKLEIQLLCEISQLYYLFLKNLSIFFLSKISCEPSTVISGAGCGLGQPV